MRLNNKEYNKAHTWNLFFYKNSEEYMSEQGRRV